jgi:hypothetical protein
MSCPTAESWSVPDEVYDLTKEDYVFCNQDALAVERSIADMMEHANCEECKECGDPKLKTYFHYLQYGPHWFVDHYRGGLVLYMDANEKDASHKQYLMEMMAKENLSEAVEISQIPRQTLREYLDTQMNHPFGPSEMFPMYQHGYLGPATIDCIITQKTTEAKKDMLTWVSDQNGLKYVRPTMVFIGAVWDVLSTPGPPTPGLAFAYDFINDVIIVKTITYESGKHPLATPWPTTKGEDGFYLCIAPKEIIQEIKNAEERKGSEDTAFWLHVIILGLVGKWVLGHGEALGVSDDLREDLTKQLAVIRTDLEKTELPSYEKRKPAQKNGVSEALEILLYDLERNEDRVRDVALMAKEAGMVATAETLAKDFERTRADLKRIVEHPEKPS